ncbi:MAG: FAD:protein FMN transferase [Candidatus Brocadiales bacterium]|nr:FAD:protein FMN transferase [Candidatus Brocadiales bacterium]
MKFFNYPCFLFLLILVITLTQNTAFSQYDYILGQKITIDEIEPADNYEIEVIMDVDNAIISIFEGCDEVFVEHLELTPDEKERIENKLKARILENSFDVFTGKKMGSINKYAIITDEMGCFHPITFIMSMKPSGKIEKVSVLIYRESRGKDVIRKRFLHQYKGKTLKSPIRINKDIINVSGATTSVRGVNRGVRKMRAVLDAFYLDSNREVNYIPYSIEGMHVSEEEARQIYSQARSFMGGIIEILITGTIENHAAKAFQEAFAEVDRLNRILNKDQRKSKIYKINKKAWKKTITCGKEFLNIIKSSLYYSKITNGGFDITEGTLIDTLSRNKKKFHKQEDITSLINASTYENIVIDEDENGGGTIFIKDKQTKIDLSLLVNGYVVDKVITVLENNDILHALVNFGDTIRVIGNPPDDTVWRIAISNPEDRAKSIGFLKISNKAVAISGEYEKMLIDKRKEYSYIAGVKIQKSFDSRILETIVIAHSALEADALSAATYLSGLNKDMGLIGSISDTEGIDIYEREKGGIEIERSNGMETYFVQRVEPIY